MTPRRSEGLGHSKDAAYHEFTVTVCAKLLTLGALFGSCDDLCPLSFRWSALRALRKSGKRIWMSRGGVSTLDAFCNGGEDCFLDETLEGRRRGSRTIFGRGGSCTRVSRKDSNRRRGTPFLPSS
jgi:hypothetical protein